MIKEYKLSIPQALAGITLRQYQQYLKILDKWDKEDEVYIKTKMLQIFCGLEIEDTFKIPLNNFDFAIDVINKCFKEETPLVPRFSMSATDEYGEETVVEFGFIPKLDEMTFGEFIDLDGYISDWDKMHKAMAVLFRPVIFKKNEFYRIMDYEGSHKYSDVMLDMPVSVAIGAMVFFLSFREQITKLYSGLFTEGAEREGDSTTAQANFGKKWGWYQSIFTIAQEDAAKIDKATKLPVHTCLMYLEYIKDKTKIENALIKKAHRK